MGNGADERAVEPSRGGSIRAALRAEWTKFRTVRGWMVGLVFAALMIVLFTYLQANGKHTGLLHDPEPEQLRDRPPIRADRTRRRSGRRHLRARRQAPDRRWHDHRADHLAGRPDLGRAGQPGAVSRGHATRADELGQGRTRDNPQHQAGIRVCGGDGDRRSRRPLPVRLHPRPGGLPGAISAPRRAGCG